MISAPVPFVIKSSSQECKYASNQIVGRFKYTSNQIDQIDKIVGRLKYTINKIVELGQMVGRLMAVPLARKRS